MDEVSGVKKYLGLNAMLEGDPVIREYYDKLPGHVREHIRREHPSVSSFDRLLRCADSLIQ
ncbi:hypothetical protein SDC9_65904 [bioreactor metagenome]|uniref:Uncharacterized protein n=1 Tax=bioreactor metagenome TaxID=1076179 RepID=A0A644XTE5_9ZZZZ